MINKICVAGAGTMGIGIAMCAAQNGVEVILFDNNKSVLEVAQQTVEKNLNALIEKNKITSIEKTEILNRIVFTTEINTCKAPLIIEAIIEKAEIKIQLFNELSKYNDTSSIFASNTSSLSINLLQQNISNPERVAGLHFFNPAQIMKLVEVVKAEKTNDEVIAQLTGFCIQLKKSPVVCIDAPGFIVNRVARHYYLEAMRLVENNQATIEQVDEIMEASGFKMGPFKLMDLIGNDINLAVTTSLYDAFNHEHRFEPSILQINKVKYNELGRKTGKGFFEYAK
jgi:3-hydroxybutyryl-CoA dehydrogenase